MVDSAMYLQKMIFLNSWTGFNWYKALQSCIYLFFFFFNREILGVLWFVETLQLVSYHFDTLIFAIHLSILMCTQRFQHIFHGSSKSLEMLSELLKNKKEEMFFLNSSLKLLSINVSHGKHRSVHTITTIITILHPGHMVIFRLV